MSYIMIVIIAICYIDVIHPQIKTVFNLRHCEKNSNVISLAELINYVMEKTEFGPTLLL
jgi:hypothetical protein